MENAGKRCVAEIIGTFTLVFVGAGSICMGAYDHTLGTLGVAVAHGLALSVMISALMAVSGAHFNPAVTFGFLLTGRIGTGMAGLYALSQLTGGVVAAYLLRMIFSDVWRDMYLGTPMINGDAGITTAQAVLVEMILTFFLVVVVFGTAVDSRAPKIAGFAIGLTVTADILMGGALTGAAMNPARAFGPALAAGIWDVHYVYWIGPLLGGGLAALLYHHLMMER
ncbi:MAG: aquaporin [Acidobacteriota bacterium]